MTFKQGDLERSVAGFCGIGGGWERYSYTLKDSVLTQTPGRMTASNQKPTKIQLAGATIKPYPNNARIEELRLTPYNAYEIRLRDTVVPSKHALMKQWMEAILKSISDAPKPEPALGHPPTAGQKRWQGYQAVNTEEMREDIGKPRHDTLAEVWSVYLVRWGNLPEGQAYEILAFGYSSMKYFKRTDEDFINNFFVPRTGRVGKVEQEVNKKVEANESWAATQTKYASDSTRQVTALTDRQGMIDAHVTCVIFRDDEFFSVPQAVNLATAVLARFRDSYKSPGVWSRDECKDFDKVLEETAQTAYEKYNHSGKSNEVADKIKTVKLDLIDNIKSEQRRHTVADDVLDKAESFRENSEGFEKAANDLKWDRECKLLKARLVLLLVILILLALVGGLVYNFLPK